MTAELVVLGPSFPFYNDFLSGVSESCGPTDERLRVQLSVFGEFVAVCGNLNFLSGFWNQVGTITRHQSSFVSYDWSPDRLSLFFHHVFTVAMNDISTHVGFMGGFSVEFEKKGRYLYLSVRFWHEDQLCKVSVARCGRTVSLPTGCFGMMSRFLSVISTAPDLIASSGCPEDYSPDFQ